MVVQYKFEELDLSGVIQITSFFSSDDRGYSLKYYSQKVFHDHGINFVPVEALTIESKENVLRGLHYQRVKGQGKLVSCAAGSIWAVVVDLRRDSKTCGKWVSTDISDGKELLIPKGCAFGTYALEDSEILCLCDDVFLPEYATGIRWDDPDLKIGWPFKGQRMPLLSERDNALPAFKEYMREN